ncbi:MAG TPA: dihydrofolate reductase family protein [Streptosporangiaceae bacterium]|jgi:dihydrofolate reductase|nr:dihydrofolate reductase family protein [Streptosporangiaceae bacterium]
MRKLSIVEFVTLDGVMQSLGSPDEDREGGFAYGGWSAPYGDEIAARAAGAGMADVAAYLFGRKTYEKMAAHWPFEPATNPIAAHLNATPKYVVTKTLTSVEWSGTQILSGDPAASVRDLKQAGDGSITVLGSGVLVQTLIEHDLIDEYRIFVHPLVLGTGKRLFREIHQPLRLRLLECTQTSTGVLLLTYQPESR